MSNSFGLRVFDIKPSEGIGFIKLGTTIFQMVNLLKANNINEMRFIYSENKINHAPITIELVNLSIRLTFEPICQKLILIEVNNWKSCKFFYHRELVNGNSTRIPNFKSIYNKFFGPTYPGEFKSELDTYLLSYPGICFKFDLPLNLSKKLVSQQDKPEMLIPLMDNHQSSNINCTSFMIFKGSSREDAIVPIKEIPNLDAILYLRSLTGDLKYLASYPNQKRAVNYLKSCINLELPQRVIIEYCEISIPLGIMIINFAKHPRNLKRFMIKIGITTMQDIIITLGQPDEAVNKLVDSKIMIHREFNDGGANNNSASSSAGSNENTIVKIYNYFHLGLDIVYDLDQGNDYDDSEDDELRGSPLVSKLICHNNMVNSLDFMKYERLLFVSKPYNLEDLNKTSIREDYLSSLTVDKSKPFEIFDITAKKLNYTSTDSSYLYNTSLHLQDFHFAKNSKPMFLNRRDYELSIDSNDALDSKVELDADHVNSAKTNSCNNFEFIDFEDEIELEAPQPLPQSQNTVTSVSSEDLKTTTSEDGTPHTSNSSASASASTATSVSSSGAIDKASSWGLSKLQSHGRCIFEIMIDGETISSLTLF